MVATLNTTSVPSPNRAKLGEYKYLIAGNIIYFVKNYTLNVDMIISSAQYVIYFHGFQFRHFFSAAVST
jgi:hypothetical protein